MGFQMPHNWTMIALGLSVMAIMLHTLGISTMAMAHERIILNNGTVLDNWGLFSICHKDVCRTDSKDTMIACRVLGVVGITTLLACGFFGALYCFIQNKIFPVLAATASTLGGLCCSCEAGLFLYHTRNLSQLIYGYSFFFTLLSGPLGIAIGIFHLTGRAKSR